MNDVKLKKWTNDQDAEFQVTSWESYHEEMDTQDSEDPDPLLKYTIRLYGTLRDGRKIYVQVDDFCPYFYVEIPAEWGKRQIDVLLKHVNENVYPTKFRNGLKSNKIVQKNKFKNFNNYKLFKFLKLDFYSHETFRAYSRVLNRKILLNLSKTATKYRIWESNIDPIVRCMHTRNLEASGWINILKGQYTCFDDEEAPSYNDVNIYTSYKNLNPVINDRSMAKIIIASYDIECFSHDGKFPQPKRPEDKTIQIGTTFNYLGESECFYKHISTLGSCSPIEGVDVEACHTEQDMILTWARMIRRINPDILTGYNIFGFDDKYLEIRTKDVLKINPKLLKLLSRLKETPGKFVEKDLSSSALGDNKLFYYNMPGVVRIDLMKVIMREHNLESYKLDDVASEFIREVINKTVQIKVKNTDNIKTRIETKSTYGLAVDRFIKIYYNDGLSDNAYQDGLKFNVKKMSADSITVNSKLDNEIKDMIKDTDNYKVFWCQAKDDIKPQDIFDMQLMGPDERAKVAKYCIQDCELCNKIFEKLQVVTNNISMSSVCSVPLSYIFLRGQGIKIFSLVAKKCRERDHVMPVIRRRDQGIDIVKGYFSLTTVDGIINKFSRRAQDYDKAISRTRLRNIKLETLQSYTALTELEWMDKQWVEDLELEQKYEYMFNKEKLVTELTNKGKLYKISNYESKISNIKKLPMTKLRSTAAELEISWVQSVIKRSLHKYKNVVSNETIVDMLKQAAKLNDLKLESSKWADLLKLDNKVLRYLAGHLETRWIVETEGFEGATVLKPERGVYFRPITVLDYASLYPSSMIHRNLSHECLIVDPAYLNLEEYFYYEVTFHNKDGSSTICVFAKAKNGMPGILPEILQNLLSSRKATKKLMAEETDPFKKSILNGLQTAYKLTANSLYGQTGAPTSPIYYRPIAACTTATGREMLNAARLFQEQIFLRLTNSIIKGNYKLYSETMNNLFKKNIDAILGEKAIENMKRSFYKDNEDPNDFSHLHRSHDYFYFRVFQERKQDIVDDDFVNKKTGVNSMNDFIKKYYDDLKQALDGVNVDPHCVYGDTDSIFVDYRIRDQASDELITDQRSLETAMKLGILSGDLINFLLPKPQNLEYEKTFHPWILVSKKRYVGNKYEFNPKKYSQNSMGIVLKRRDNAQIVKIVVGGIVQSILNARSAQKAVDFTNDTLKKIFTGQYPIDKYILSKKLKDGYKDRTRIVHAVLADRIAARDPGNKPQLNDRIPYIFVDVGNQKVEVQGERVESPDFIVENGLKIDYLYYLEHQIMKPSIQFLELLINNPQKIFDKHIFIENNNRKGLRPVEHYFKQINDSDDSDDSDNSDVGFSINNTLVEQITYNKSEPTSMDKAKIKVIKSKAKVKAKPKTKKLLISKANFNKDDGGFVLDL